MAETWKRLCLADQTFTDGDTSVTLRRGVEYITSAEREDGQVTVFTDRWFRAPAALFAGAVRFT